MEDLNIYQSSNKDSFFSKDMIVLLTAMTCIVNGKTKITLLILVKFLELYNLIKQRQTQSYPESSDLNLNDAIAKLKCQAALTGDQYYEKISTSIEMIQKVTQMKDLLDAINEMKKQNSMDNPSQDLNPDTNNSVNNTNDGLSLDLLTAILPPDQKEMADTLIHLLNSNSM